MSSVDLLNKIRTIEDEAQKKIETAKIDGEEKLKTIRKEASEKIERAKKEAHDYQKKLADDLLTSTKAETTKIGLDNQKQIAEMKNKITANKSKAVDAFVKLVTSQE